MPGQAREGRVPGRREESCMRPNDTDLSAMEVRTPRAATDTRFAFLPTFCLLFAFCPL